MSDAKLTSKKVVRWSLTSERINDLQIVSIDRVIARAKQAHHLDICVRINGKNEWHQADWIKHIVRQPSPWWLRMLCALRDHGGIEPLNGNVFGEKARCKRCGAIVRLV